MVFKAPSLRAQRRNPFLSLPTQESYYFYRKNLPHVILSFALSKAWGSSLITLLNLSKNQYSHRSHQPYGFLRIYLPGNDWVFLVAITPRSQSFMVFKAPSLRAQRRNPVLSLPTQKSYYFSQKILPHVIQSFALCKAWGSSLITLLILSKDQYSHISHFLRGFLRSYRPRNDGVFLITIQYCLIFLIDQLQKARKLNI